MKPFLEGNEDPVTVLLAREMEAITDADIVDWANRHAAPESYVHDLDYTQLVRFNRRNPDKVGKPRQYLMSLVGRVFPEFDHKSQAAQDMARTLFLRRIRSYLDGDLEPMQICRMVTPIEDAYNFPPWLGGLYDACDWMDERTTREQATHLRDEIEQILSDNGESLRSGVVE
jgi:hypothetical protein